VAYNVVLCAREYVKIENYDRTSAGFRYHARRTAKADKREIYVYVIGEASRAANWELYGYDRPTNPRLKALGDEIVVFRNMLTQSNTTHKSVPMILSSVRTNEHDELFRRKGLPALFNEAGFRTWFLSNQSPQGAMIDKLARDADSLIYMGHPRYDMQLLDTMKRIVEADTENDLLFILHCYGSHFSYHQRYPREAAYFLPDDDVAIERQHKQKIWNAYDNSIRYTDTFLSSVIGYLASLDACSALLYSADHGEDMLDDDRERFLHASPTTTCWQLHVASLAWFSEDYKRVFPQQAAAAASDTCAFSDHRRHRPYRGGLRLQGGVAGKPLLRYDGAALLPQRSQPCRAVPCDGTQRDRPCLFPSAGYRIVAGFGRGCTRSGTAGAEARPCIRGGIIREKE